MARHMGPAAEKKKETHDATKGGFPVGILRGEVALGSGLKKERVGEKALFPKNENHSQKGCLRKTSFREIS